MRNMNRSSKALDFFFEICQIPRPSGHEEKMTHYLEQFAKSHKLAYDTDSAGNVLIRKPAALGREAAPGIVLQAHTDMVPSQREGIEHDFLKDPIRTKIEGEWLSAQGTTLGADNGIGVAAALAVLDANDIKHGPIECLFTVSEEDGLGGASTIASNWMKSPYLINLDSEEEGEIFVGCAGGNQLSATFNYTEESAPEGYFFASVAVSNLQGGHSGDDIDKGRANAIKLLAGLLNEFSYHFPVHIASISGGDRHNTIPISAGAFIAVPWEQKEPLRILFNVFTSELEREYRITDPNMHFALSSEDNNKKKKFIPYEDSKRILNALLAAPTGVYSFSQEAPSFVQTSNNLAIVTQKEGELTIYSSQRSDSSFALQQITRMLSATFELAGAKVEWNEGYPGWTPIYDSPLLSIAKKEYTRLFQKEAKVKTIHAGLECGLLSSKYPEMQMISFGPTLRGVHTPEEKMHLPSLDKFWIHLEAILEAI